MPLVVIQLVRVGDCIQAILIELVEDLCQNLLLLVQGGGFRVPVQAPFLRQALTGNGDLERHRHNCQWSPLFDLLALPQNLVLSLSVGGVFLQG